MWQPEGITVLGDSNRQRSLHCNEDGRKDREGEEIVGCNSFGRRSAVRLADPLAKSQPSNHSMRTLPPTLMRTMRAFGPLPERCWVAFPRGTSESYVAYADGQGLRSAARCAPAAFWASWADSLEMIRDRTPEVAELVDHQLTAEDPQNGFLEELRAAAAHQDRQGFWWRPGWTELRESKRPSSA